MPGEPKPLDDAPDRNEARLVEITHARVHGIGASVRERHIDREAMPSEARIGFEDRGLHAGIEQLKRRTDAGSSTAYDRDPGHGLEAVELDLAAPGSPIATGFGN